MPKRGDRAGTVNEYPKGSGRWWAKLPPGPDGKRPKRLAHSKEEAEVLLRQMHAEREAGRDLRVKAGTVTELVENLLTTVEAHRRGGTIRAYRNAAKHLRHIGALKIDAVTTETVQGLADKLARITGPYQIRRALSLLSRAYDRVVPERVRTNPVQWKRLTLGKAVRQERQPAEVEDLLPILRAADDLGERGAYARLAVAWWLGILLGMRRGEIAGLTWKDVDFTRNEINIRFQVAEDRDGKHAPGQPTKTAAGVRTIPMGPRLAARLRAHQQSQAAERLRQGKNWKRLDLVVCAEDGAPITLSALNKDLERLCEASGTPRYTPHQLRHALATLVADEGFTEAVAASLLGHERRGSITARYIHAKPATKRAAIELVEARILGLAAEEERAAQ